MNQQIKDKLIQAAIENPGVRHYKLAAGIVFKGRLVCIGLNQRKTHPIMLNSEYREQQIHLHAEADAILRARRMLTDDQLASCAMVVARVKRSHSTGPYVEAMAKPCPGCMSLICEHKIKELDWTE